MSSIIKFDTNVIDMKKINSEGRTIYNTNPFFNSLANIMETPEFMYIFDKHFDTWDNIELFVMFAKVYDSITKQFPDMLGYEKVALVKRLVDNSNTRKMMCQEIKNFRNSTIDKNKIKKIC